MKRLITFAFMTICMVVSCSEFDDSAIWDKLNDHETRLAYLEEVCKKMNTDIVNLQTIVTALETNDYIVNASPLATGDGYTFIFKSGKSVVIYNGKDGKNGTDGKDGIDGNDGNDGVTPTISVMKDVDGVYYWTVNGEWLLVNGQKVKASATDGRDGQNGTNGTNGVNGTNGKDGITPKFKIEEEYWFVSYDNGQSWEKLGKATGENGLNGINGADGESIFKGITLYDGYVVFILNDGEETIIKLPFQSETALTITLSESCRLEDVLTPPQCRNVLYLKIHGSLTTEDLKYLLAKMHVLETLDLSEALWTDNSSYQNLLNPWSDMLINKTIREVSLPPSVKWHIDYMLGLETIKLSPGFGAVGNDGVSLKCLPYLKEVYFTEGITLLPSSSINSNLKLDFYLPSTLSEVDEYAFFENNVSTGGFRPKSVTIYADVPPVLTNNAAGFYITLYNIGDINVPLYVPEGSIGLYRNAAGWKQFVNILPIE